MPISMYQASIPHFVLMLGKLSARRDKTLVHAEATQFDQAVFINARLAPDMYPLSRQIQISADMAKACAARLAGIEVPRYEDNETTLAELQARIAKTIAFLQRVDVEQINDSEEQTVKIIMHDKEIVYSGQHYLLDIIIPHFYFHVTIAYAILRHHGIDIGKSDYINNE
jgi:hypothetical protein